MILPIAIFVFIFKFAFPKKYPLNLHNSLRHFTAGIGAVFLVLLFNMFFTNWSTLSNITPNFYLSVFIKAFIEVAFLEELSKLISNKIALSKKKKLDPLKVIFYSMCVGAGFGFAETMLYISAFGKHVILLRALTASPLHMLTASIIGLGMALKILTNKKIYNYLALLLATFIHGIYDYNIMAKVKLVDGILTQSDYQSFPVYYILIPSLLFIIISILVIKKVFYKNMI